MTSLLPLYFLLGWLVAPPAAVCMEVGILASLENGLPLHLSLPLVPHTPKASPSFLSTGSSSSEPNPVHTGFSLPFSMFFFCLFFASL